MTIQLLTNSGNAFKMGSGSYTLTTFTLTTTDHQAIALQLQQMVRKLPNFFSHNGVVIDVRGLDDALPVMNLYTLRHLFMEHGLAIMALTGDCERYQQEAFIANIPWIPTGNAVDAQAASNVVALHPNQARHVTAELSGSATTYIDQPVRTGQQIYAKGDLVIMAPVSFGAEVLAAGSIHVYGPLRGRALAGVEGDPQARIFAQQYEPQLTSICGQYTLYSNTHGNPEFWGEAVIVSLEEQRLHIRRV